ncbi:MAG: glutamate racemase [Chitinophagia bacterium]|nr:glutamate racemase [Chitinophagia bacterium]
MDNCRPIGIFDSGYGGLTVFRSIAKLLPAYDYLYLGDNARAPYGNRTYETVYHYTLECVQWFFRQGCPLVILACNTASAKALRTIQQHDLPLLAPDHRVLGVIRPTAEAVGQYTHTGHVGILGTRGTVTSQSYPLEIQKLYPNVQVHQVACPMLVPLVEYGEYRSPAADYFVQQYLDELFSLNAAIDTVVLACTHYPLLLEKFERYVPAGVQLVSQGNIVAERLADYLNRHASMADLLTKGGRRALFTTDNTADFDRHGREFFGEEIVSQFAAL